MKKSAIFFLLVLLSAFPPLSTDMYLPAIPLLQKTWQQPLTVVNLTLVCFFVSYCLFLLVYGPISDRCGRKPPLLVGLVLFIVASLLCALSTNVGSLILFRVLQAAGAAAAAALAMAMTKDLYRSEERVRILAWIGVIMALAPAVAPILGSWLMVWASWRWIFVCQAAVAAVALIGVLRMEETLQEKSNTSALETATIYLQLFRNRRYMAYALMISLVVLPHFGYIAGAADIYITRFGLSEQTFGYLFAINALSFMSGSLLCTRLLRWMSPGKVMSLGFAGFLLGGIIMLLRLFPDPWSLVLPMIPITFSLGLSRPPSNNLVLEQVDRNAGAASSLLVFIFFIIGAFAMWLISLDWSDKVQVIGLLATGVGVVTLSCWTFLARREARN
ncbi:MFS transporter, DHA1 family, bicyclomycin/chloramphenicol resistance protein [Malonomonas rubra DSM 5091]|uniref:MFS transporter, DHA1 family, bicyclomycin/chloramphenicol resistance protein n=1 Tax=Malonomonas rubra DSM 5091 TaxID=1122189 RepID=A0A1M6HCI3_MALRU|nr:multidrug effflux MFS transporter [Malonomonas rubra]SHJ19900.1 MFS transporter, DHA1 family, bicyclomycin/chloramphenicol resistance protein [Malonomonas rubra DSM 5091]